MVVLKLLGPTPVLVTHPQRGPLVAEVFGTGTLEAKATVSFSAKMVDKVVAVLVDQGDTVTDGQVLARLEATDYEHTVRVAEAGVGQAQAELAKAHLDIARQRALLGTGVVSRAEVDIAEAAHLVGEAKLKNSEAQLGFARSRLADTVIASPVPGLVLTRNLEVGDTVVPGAPIFRIADTRQLWITAMVDERVAGELRVGQPARVSFRGHPGRSFPGRLARLGNEADRVTEEREADVTVEQLPPDWFIGAKADVYIETARAADAIQVPKGAIVPRGDQPGVLVIDDGHARWRPVRLGLSGRDAVEIVDGLDGRDLVITNAFAGKQPLTDGQRVAPIALTVQAP
jgi:HlyD family secretion protein